MTREEVAGELLSLLERSGYIRLEIVRFANGRVGGNSIDARGDTLYLMDRL